MRKWGGNMWNGLDYKPFFDTMSRQILHDRASDAIPIFRGQGTGGGGQADHPRIGDLSSKISDLQD